MSKEEAIRVALMYARDRGFVGPDEVEAVAVEREAYWFVGIDQIQPAMIGGDVGVKLLKDGTALTVTFGR